MECMLCKIQYAGKSKTPFNLRSNNQINKTIPASHHFKIPGHNFMKHAKFILIEQLSETSRVSTQSLRLRLKQREDFWTIKLEALALKLLNQETNKV